MLVEKLKELRILENFELPASVIQLLVKPKETSLTDMDELIEPEEKVVEPKVEELKPKAKEAESKEVESGEEDVQPEEEDVEPEEEELDDEVILLSVLDPQLPKGVRMANLSVVGGHTVNGVAEIHSDIVKEEVFNSFYQVFHKVDVLLDK